MKVRISPTGLTIHPHLSTSWKNISSLYIEKKQEATYLIILLRNGHKTSITGLNKQVIENILDAHAQSLEKKQLSKEGSTGMINLGLPLDFDGNVETLGASMQHNPSQADSPDLPFELLEKITKIVKAISPEMENLPKAEPHCNCFHCQIAGAIQNNSNHLQAEKVTDDDLTFRSWEIVDEGNNSYLVTHPINKEEKYHVYLGKPLGCTCGEKNCEHIKTVLENPLK